MLALRSRCSGDGDRLPLASGELARLGVDVRHVDVDVVEVLPGQLAHLALVEHAQGAEMGELVVEEQVQVHGQLGNESEVLVDGLDPMRGGVFDRAETHLFALEQEPPRVL